MTHEEIKNIFSEVYNKFYLTHKRNENDPPRTEDDWDLIITEGQQIVEKYNHCKLVKDMILDIEEIFESQDSRIKK